MKHILRLTIILIGLFSMETAYSQKLAIKSNLLYDATGTMNLGFELGLNKRLSLDISGNYNPWDDNNGILGSEMKHYLIQPELRYWLCETFSGHYFGIHSHYAYFNVNGDNWLLGSFKTLSNFSGSETGKYRSEGWLAGAGLSYGYHWIIKERWSLEGNIGVGYAYMDFDNYNNKECGELIAPQTEHYFGVTKLGLTLVFIIK